jgi:HEAT repeat protein
LPAFGFNQPAPALQPDSLAAMKEGLKTAGPDVRAAIAYALGRFQPDPAFVPALAAAIRDPVSTVRAAALKGLHDLADGMPFVPPQEFKAALDDSSPGVRYWAAGALGHVQRGLDPYVPIMIQHAEHDPDRRVREVCVSEIRDMVRPKAVSAAMVPILTKALESPVQEVRCAACGLLGRLGQTATPAIPALLRLLKDDRGAQGDRPAANALLNQQYAAATALGRLAPGTPFAEQAAAALIDLVKAEPPPWAVNQLIALLPPFGSVAKGAIPRLHELAGSSNAAIKDAAQEALGKLTAAD